MFKKGAMFGLDARIALAIFGALSVVSGAALYSSIRESRIASFVSETREMAKALEQYVLDTGQIMGLAENVSTGSSYRNIYELTSSTVSGWKGPYFEFSTDAGQSLHYARHKNILSTTSSVSVLERAADGSFSACSTSKCTYWISLNYIPVGYAVDLKRYADNTEDTSHIGKSNVGTQSADYIVFSYRALTL
jgi:type II secretory pathway pseudopilin PulG